MTDRTAEEWGRVAVSLPGWRWMPGMMARFSARSSLRLANGGGGLLWGNRLGGESVWSDDGVWSDPDDPATAGCLLALLGGETDSLMLLPNEAGLFEWYDGKDWQEESLPLGRACIAAAEALGRWPGGAG